MINDEEHGNRLPLTAQDIRDAVDAGKRVTWANDRDEVVRSAKGRTPADYYIKDIYGGSVIGLTWSDGVTLNGTPEQFTIHEG